MNLVYEAIDTKGRNVQDTVQAASIKEGVEALRRQGLFVTHVAPATVEAAQGAAARDKGSAGSTRLPIKQLMMFTRQISMLLTSGSALVPAINAVAAQMKNPSHRLILDIIKDDLEQGLSLTDALRKHPGAFDASYCAVVAAGESSATLPQMFNRLATIIGKRRATRNKIIGALIYPALLMGLSFNIMGVMMFFVVPRFSEMFVNLGVELPMSTKVIMAVADTLKSQWILILLAVIAIISGLVYLLRTTAGKQILSNAQTRVPLLKILMSRLIQGQTFRILGMLLEARVGLLESLELARGVTTNDQFQGMYDTLEDSVTRGESISQAIERCGLVSPSVVQAIRTGEQSGRMGEAVSFVADILDEENTELLGTATKLIEPLILIFMGFIVGTIAISLFMPLFDMTSAI
ncbi:MAG: type II secretion system F family protein [Planctomycetes bacterium]|nr:type II secretion system F family protein [Planctomycetota bacterium]